MAKILCVLYPDPVDGYPPKYARDSIPVIDHYADGSSAPTPEAIDFTPGELLGSVSGELGLRKFLEAQGHQLVVTSDKDGADSVFEKELPSADVVISQPFWPAYLDAARLDKAKNLKLAITAGIGSDHVDLNAANKHGVTVAEVTNSNSISVAEHAVMQLLALVRNYLPSHDWARNGGWNIADCVSRSYDLEGMTVGIVSAGRIGRAVMERLRPFGVHLLYTQRHVLPPEVEQQLGGSYIPTLQQLGPLCDALVVETPLHPQTYHMINREFLDSLKRGTYIVNNGRGALADRDAVVEALKSGRLGGYAGDVWFPQPAEPDHPWRTMPHEGMTPHISGTSLSAQTRYAAGTREILEDFLAHRPIRDSYLITDGGHLAGTGAKAYTVSDGTASPGQV